MRGNRAYRSDNPRNAAPSVDGLRPKGEMPLADEPELDDDDDEPIEFEPDPELMRRIRARLLN